MSGSAIAPLLDPDGSVDPLLEVAEASKGFAAAFFEKVNFFFGAAAAWAAFSCSLRALRLAFICSVW